MASPDAIQDLRSALSSFDQCLSGLAGLGPANFVHQLTRRLIPVVQATSESAVLPDVDFEDWYIRASATTSHQVGSGVLAWPADERLRLALRYVLIGRIAQGDIDFLDFCYRFLGRSSIPRRSGQTRLSRELPPPPPGPERFVYAFVEHVVRPFVSDFQGVLSREWAPEAPADYPTDDSAEDDPIAVCFRHHRDKPVELATTEELEVARNDSANYMHFVDTLRSRPYAEKVGDGGNRKRERLPPAAVSMLIALLVGSCRAEPFEIPGLLAVPNPGTQGGRNEAFKVMRRKVDYSASRGKYRLFKRRPSLEGGPSSYAFEPDDGTTFCFLFAWSQFETVRRSLG